MGVGRHIQKEERQEGRADREGQGQGQEDGRQRHIRDEVGDQREYRSDRYRNRTYLPEFRDNFEQIKDCI